MSLTKFLFVLAMLQASCAAKPFVKRSLTFVVDNTTSMIDDISQIKEAARSLVDAVSAVSIEFDYALVTFGDQDAEFNLRTKNFSELKQSLGSINATGGADCPEMALSGIKRALQETQPRSLLYVFTDASAKDYRLFDEVKTLCQQKKSQITFVLTGYCSDKNSEDYQVYGKIAAACNGEAVESRKNEIQQVVNGLAERIQIVHMLPTLIEVPANVSKVVLFHAYENSIKTVSAWGHGAVLRIENESGEAVGEVIADNDYNDYDFDATTVKLENVPAGTYKAIVFSTSDVWISVSPARYN